MFRGEPHLFQSRFDEEADAYTDLFLLTKVTPELHLLLQERRAIWLRRYEAFQRHAPVGSYLPLPEDQSRLEEVTNRLHRAQDQSLHASGDIRWIGPGHNDYLVRWVEVDAGTWPGPSLSDWAQKHRIETLLRPLTEAGAAEAPIAKLAADAIEAQTRAVLWEIEHLRSGLVDEAGWIGFFEAGYEAIGQCEAALEAYVAKARAGDLADALDRVIAVLDRRPSLATSRELPSRPDG
ncbi:MAG: hypothetical protein KIS96_15515 [Bauldia sp.]|nr:hypothetical protein [Bauldia sp.]